MREQYLLMNGTNEEASLIPGHLKQKSRTIWCIPIGKAGVKGVKDVDLKLNTNQIITVDGEFDPVEVIVYLYKKTGMILWLMGDDTGINQAAIARMKLKQNTDFQLEEEML
ncbi:OLC1v1000666C1 [Oldenlandia corymbosa var. corymbosa]|uniref:OLC1v1000666C1 n=1 Tax=Oldenlandia corymbosa var. corymbosa TaxID=529605 RepID=A0AAV1D669_OLDCO|nr:OLC1v1000666C1 [Oldenlandia corymbosa var. corymbosa]